MLLQLLKRHLDALLQLRVVALTPQGRIEIHFDVWGDSFVLYVELADIGII